METSSTPENPQTKTDERHFRQSSYREMIVETLFLGELLRYLWSVKAPAEVLYSMRDNGGYDLAIECNSVVRFIQLKTMTSPRRVRVNARLAGKPGACVVGIVIDPDTLTIRSYRWIGWNAIVGGRDRVIPDFESFAPALSLRYDRNGKRVSLPDTRVVPAGAFDSVTSVPELARLLFGVLASN